MKEPILMKAGDKRVLVNGYPLPVNYRIVWEENYQELKKAFDMRSVAVTFTEKEKQILDVLLKLDLHKVKTYNTNDKNFEEFVSQHNKLIEKIESLP